MPVTAPRPASKGEKGKAKALERSAAPCYQTIINAFVKDSGRPVPLCTVYTLLMVASHRGLDVSWQGSAWADSSFYTSSADDTYLKAVCGSIHGTPDKQFFLFNDNLHGQTTDEFKSLTMPLCKAILWILPAGCTDEIQPIDAGYGRLVLVHVGKAIDQWLLDADHVELWQAHKLTTSQRK